MDFLVWLEQTGLGSWVRESPSIWAYPTVLFLHTMGLSILVGVSAAVDLRILGFGARAPLAPMQKFFSLLWLGFWINAVSGAALLVADATTKLTNPVFFVKLVFIALAVINVRILKRQVFGDPLVDQRSVPMRSKFLACTSLILWVAATTAGRLMAYIGPVSGLE
jgi:hypothetical protein